MTCPKASRDGYAEDERAVLICGWCGKSQESDVGTVRSMIDRAVAQQDGTRVVACCNDDKCREQEETT